MRLIFPCILLLIAIPLMADELWTWHEPCSTDNDKTRCDVWFDSHVPAGDITVEVDGSPINTDIDSYQDIAAPSANAILLHLPGLTRDEVGEVKSGITDLLSSFRQPHQQVGLFTSTQDGFQHYGFVGDSPEELSKTLRRWRSPASARDPLRDLITVMEITGGNQAERKAVYWLTTTINQPVNLESISKVLSKQDIRLVIINLVRSELDQNSSARLRELGHMVPGFYSSVRKNRWGNDLSKYAAFTLNGRIISFENPDSCGERSLSFSTSLDNIPGEYEEPVPFTFRLCQGGVDTPDEETTAGTTTPQESPTTTGETTLDEEAQESPTGPTGETTPDEGTQEEPTVPTGETTMDEGAQEGPTGPTGETTPDEGTQEEPTVPTGETTTDEGAREEPTEPIGETTTDVEAEEEPSTVPAEEPTVDEGVEEPEISPEETTSDEEMSEGPVSTDPDADAEPSGDDEGPTPDIDDRGIPLMLFAGVGLGLLLIILIVLIRRNTGRKSFTRPAESHGTVVIEEAGQLRRYELTKFTTRIGRSQENDIVLSDDSVSAFHALLKVGQDGRVSLSDLNSTNHSFVNGVQVTDQVLSSGDSIRLGVFSFSFEAN